MSISDSKHVVANKCSLYSIDLELKTKINDEVLKVKSINVQASYSFENEISNICVDNHKHYVGAIDDLGYVTVINLSLLTCPTCDSDTSVLAAKKLKNNALHLSPYTDIFGSKGWSGVCICSPSSNYPEDLQIATARFWYKDVALYKGVQMEQHMTLPNHPTQVSFLPIKGHTGIFTAELNTVRIYDCRVGLSPQKRIGSVRADTGKIYCISKAGQGYFAFAGEDRTVYVVDERKLSPLKKISNCSKYSISFLHADCARIEDLQSIESFTKDKSRNDLTSPDNSYHIGSFIDSEYRHVHLETNSATSSTAGAVSTDVYDEHVTSSAIMKEKFNSNGCNERKLVIQQESNYDLKKESEEYQMIVSDRHIAERSISQHADSRWIGLDYLESSRNIYGISEKGTLFSITTSETSSNE